MHATSVRHTVRARSLRRNWTAVQANEAFAGGRVGEALAEYELALTYVDEELLMQLEGRYLDSAHAVAAPILVNEAACHLRLNDWASACATTSKALSMAAPDDAQLRGKALFRRARAREALQQMEDALEDLRLALSLCAPASSCSQPMHVEDRTAGSSESLACRSALPDNSRPSQMPGGQGDCKGARRPARQHEVAAARRRRSISQQA
jgi:hypothetical protein